MADLFALAARKKFRFESPQGPLSVEELWDLPLQTTRAGRASLDNIAINLDRQLKDAGTVSFVDEAPAGNDDLRAKFDIVLRIIEVRKAENKAAEEKRANAEKKERILSIIAEKQDEELKGKSVDELKQLVGAL